MIWVFLQVERVEQLHAEQIRRFGGSSGLRDRGLLISAVARAENKVWYDDNATVPQVAASLAWGLIKNHAFVDGNKRVGYAAMVALLDLNGYQPTCSEHDETLIVKRVAASEMTEDEWTKWVESNVIPIPVQ